MDENLNDNQPKKTGRGNKNFQKGKQNPYLNKNNNNQNSQKTMPGDNNKTETTENTNGGFNIDMNSEKIATHEIPLAGPRVEKEYAKVSDGGSGGAKNNDGSGKKTEELGQEENVSNTTETENLGQPTNNQSVQENDPGAKSPEQIRTEAEQFVLMLIKGYEKLHGLGRWYGKIDIQKLTADHIAGKIDLNLELPLGKSPIAVAAWLKQYNEGIDEAITVSEEFKNEITPPLVRIAIKREWGLGDEMTVAALLAEDLGTKGALLFGLKSAANQVLDACYKILQGQNEIKEEAKTNSQNSKNKTGQNPLNTDLGEQNWHKEPIQDAEEVE